MTATALALPARHAPALALSPPLVLDTLRTQLHAVVAGARPAGSPWATRIGALDAALGGGVPRGRITEVVGPMASGKTALLKQLVTTVLQTGGWVAWIDARRTLAPAPWTTLGHRFVVIRPHTGQRSTWCADLLLRSGVFSLVVIDGAPALSRVHGVRLAQLARERDAACVVLTENTHTSRISGALRLRVQMRASLPAHARDTHSMTHTMNTTTHATRSGFSVVVEKGGPTRRNRSVEVQSDISMARRVCTHSQIPDRRGVARGTRRPWAAVGGDTTNSAPQAVTWGGLAVSTHNDIHAAAAAASTPPSNRHTTRTGVVRTDSASHTTSHTKSHTKSHTERTPERKHTRDWTTYRGRRRAAESSYGKPSRRERARKKINERAHERTHERAHADTRGYIYQHVHTPTHQRASPLGRVAESARR